ncbi:NADPH-dependent F420 reductase [Xanthobacter autotrophicus]|uniref:NADPH-dependent F420 reductase n=1 Tax=Xanthobacter autotrophicus TaxID=280 RepID=UPI0024A78C22|nr:NAD(P)-binding domain-containing protein [Xanthobacter autotrophicus]MDI4655331.1 NAD(P)-binding domain-containing protein [Xanthobacter autotrophicus]
MKTLGFLGAGRLTQMLAPKVAKAGWKVVLSNSRGPETLRDLVQSIEGDVSAASPADMAAQADIVVLAIRWPQIAEATSGLPWSGKVVIDATNNRLGPKPEDVIDIGNVLSSEVVAGCVPGARLVKAFNHEPIPVFAQTLPPQGDAKVLFLAGSDVEANARVAELMRNLGAEPIDLGPIDKGGKLIAMGGALANKFKLFSPDEAKAAIEAAS